MNSAQGKVYMEWGFKYLNFIAPESTDLPTGMDRNKLVKMLKCVLCGTSKMKYKKCHYL